MLRIFRYLKPYTLSVIAVLFLLFAQAMGELALPNYMSDIVTWAFSRAALSLPYLKPSARASSIRCCYS